MQTYARNYSPSKLLQITLSIKELLLHYVKLKSYRNHKKTPSSANCHKVTIQKTILKTSEEYITRI